MVSVKTFVQLKNTVRNLLAVILFLGLPEISLWAQVTASITGTVKDASGAVAQGATVTAKHLETGNARTTDTDSSGGYILPSLSIGQYEVTAEKPGFKRGVRQGITLVVAQQAVVNITLEVGNVAQEVTVLAEAPLVNTTLSPTSGLVSENAVKDLPLNGRSFDQLLTLNVGTTNYTANARRSTFSVSGRRPEENRFLVNGVDYIGTDNSSTDITPTGASGQLLGVDAVREFNVVQNTYGAEYGKRAGGQVSIVSSSGTNQLHGDLFEFLRNSVLDARNFFDQGGVPPFKRNQFGGALGGPLRRDKVFLFGNYEGFRQRLGISNVAIVPDALARRGFLPIGPDNSEIQVPNLNPGMLPFFGFWPEPNGAVLGGGLATSISSPVQKVREDFGVFRFDYNASAKDSLSANYMVDDGENDLPGSTSHNPNFADIAPMRSQLLSFQETHIFSPALLSVATFGFSRANAAQGTFPTVPIPASLSFITGSTPGSISIGGGATTTVASSVTPANGVQSTRNVRNLFTSAGDVHYIKGNHSWVAGIWIQAVQQNLGGPAVATAGSITYPTLLAFLQDAPTQFIGVPNPTVLGARSKEIAWYVQDEFKLRPNLTLRLGLRDEMTTGWNEVSGRAANYVFDANGVILTDPAIGHSYLTQNNAKALWQPRAGLAWDPTGTGTWAVRVGAGIYNDLQDSMGHRLSAANPPFNARLTLTTPLLSFLPIPGGTQPPPACNADLQAAKQPCSIFSPGGVEPNMHTPTVQQWSLTVERELTRDFMLQFAYVGSQAYHTTISVDTNVAHPQVCSNASGCVSGGNRAATQTGRVPQGTLYLPSTPGLRPNPFVAGTFSWFFAGTSSYHAANFSLVKRAIHGLTFKINYTFSKTLDLNSAPTASAGKNEPQSILNPYDLKLSKGIAAFNLQHQFNANFSYELPFGRGQRWGRGASGMADRLISGWQWNGILTAQSGFPFTPQAGSNISGTGDTFNPDVPSRNPNFAGPVILGKPTRYFNPNAFVLPIAGTFGNVARGSLIGPGLTAFDTSLFKKFNINEKWTLQFRAEAFNLFNHANFGSPNAVVFSGNNISSSAGVITTTATTSRQLQFALKLIF